MFQTKKYFYLKFKNREKNTERKRDQEIENMKERGRKKKEEGRGQKNKKHTSHNLNFCLLNEKLEEYLKFLPND